MIIKNQKGVALLELALVIPMLVVIGIGMTEAVSWCRMNINISMLSRDLGRAAFDCSEGANSVSVNQCLDGRIDQLFGGGNLGPMIGANFVVTVWNYEGAGVAASQVGQQSKNGMLSRYTGEQISQLQSYSPAHQRIVVAEISMTRRVRHASFTSNYYSVAVF